MIHKPQTSFDVCAETHFVDGKVRYKRFAEEDRRICPFVPELLLETRAHGYMEIMQGPNAISYVSGYCTKGDQGLLAATEEASRSAETETSG